MIKVHHIAIWCRDLESMRQFYCRYFGFVHGERYSSKTHEFTSYFLHHSGNDSCMIELMHDPAITLSHSETVTGITHIALSAGSEENVRMLTETLRADGYAVVSDPRRTGDGYYESQVLDPEGNRIEITV